MAYKNPLLPITVQLHPKIILSYNIPRKTTVKKLLSVVNSYYTHHFKLENQNLQIVSLSTKLVDPQADYWLSNPNSTFQTFKKNTAFEIVYRKKDPKIYKTQIRNYIKLGKSQTNQRATIVRSIITSEIFCLFQFSKDQLIKYQNFEKILQTHSFLTHYNDFRCLPKLYKTFQSKKNFNFVIQYIPLEINAKMSIQRMKQIIIKLIHIIGQLYKIGFGYVQWKITDFQMTFNSEIRMTNLTKLSSKPFLMKQINFGKNCFELISSLLLKIEHQLEQTNCSISQIRKSFHEQNSGSFSNDSTIRMFLGYEFNDFMYQIGSGKISQMSDILRQGNWLFSNQKRFSIKNQLRFPSRVFNYGETVRNQFDQDQKYSFEAINKFFEWEIIEEQDYFENIYVKTGDKNKKKKKAKIIPLIKKKSLRKVFNKMLKNKL